MAEHNETRNGLNEDARVPKSWSRSTVADGRWMQEHTLNKYRNSDWFLASAIDSLLDKDDELTQAIADEAQARLDYDGILSGRCDFLYTSASKLREDLTTETSERQDGDAATLRDAKDYASAYANNTSAYALSEAKTYADTASSYLNGRIDGVSSTFNSYSSNMNIWKSGIETWNTGIDTWKTLVTPKLSNLQEQIDAFENATDVADVVPTSGSLNNYNKRLTPGAVIKVLSAGPDNDQQYYYRNKLEKTSAGPFHIENFEVLGSVQPYYSKSETYSKSELYDKTEMDDLLLKKLDVSANQVWALSTKQNPNYSQDQFIETLNNYQIMARIDSDFNVISETYVKKTDLNSYATNTYVNDTFASASNVYAKNATSGKEQLSNAFAEKLDKSDALSAYFHDPSTHGPAYDYTYSAMRVLGAGRTDVYMLSLYRKNNDQYETMYARKNDDIILVGKTLEIWTFSTLPDFSTNQDTYYII